ncbi:MAG: hypothetical protein HC930_14995 [Hydrococcus sp. SU_1_0]|nr:hypothetical protein [Hydrococcus sp. SU_1_0]
MKIVVKLTAILAIALVKLISFGGVLPAEAITQNFQVDGDRGYRMETIFSYDQDQQQKAISEQGANAKVLNSLKVRFYAPDGEMIANYDNIVDGIIQSNYFEFNYDLETQQLRGKVDLGGESPGEMYLKGDVEQGLSLIRVEPSGEERVIDQVSSRDREIGR